jgi:hypothetical protein
MLLTGHQNAGKNNNKTIANRPYETLSQLKYLGTTVTNPNLINEEIKNRLDLGNACIHWIQNFCILFCCLKTHKL